MARSSTLARNQSGGRGGLWWLAKPAVYIIGVVPAVWTFYLGITDQLGADPLKVLERSLGLWSLRFLVIGLAISPLRSFAGINLLRYRRAAGLLAFIYALLHVAVYVWPEQGLDLAAILKDIIKRPYITVGLLAFLILIPLAATSNAASIRKLGSAWQKLHRWVYLAAAAAALHFAMLVKTLTAEPLIYAALVSGLLLLRLMPKTRVRTARRMAAAAQ
ncbi:MAG: protein-methionine-sulfoxide reductase heme-binding subunit MsrQ [Hyphomicrobium sp.]|jgi:sulfoxide reductase heme-binding subunit YedZ